MATQEASPKKAKRAADGMISTPAAAELLGVTLSQFNRIVESTGLQPDGQYTNPHHRSGPPAKLWRKEKIRALKRRKTVKVALARTGGLPPKDYASEFAERYGTPRLALGDACEALFNLNRYTRHATCSKANKAEILGLKSSLVELLYHAEEFTDRVEKLTKTLQEQECHACFGSGCDRCDDTGVWQAKREVASYVFTFSVDGRRFVWVQPDFALTFTPRVEETRADDGKRALDIELNIPKSKLARAKALVKFALQQTGTR